MASKPKIIPPFVIGDQQHPWGGLNTANKDPRELDRGESYSQLNWITGRDKDHIELRRGSRLLGQTRRNVANTRVSGLGVGIKNTGDQVPFYSFNRKIYWYNSLTDDTIEVNIVDVLPADAIGDDVNFMPYQNLAGSYVYITSKNSSIYKATVADGNTGDILDLAVADYHFNFAKINRGYMFGMQRKGASQNSNDATGLYLSTPDSIANNNVTIPLAVGTGDGVTTNFSGTIPVTPLNTVYFLTITDTVETFIDDKNGHLKGDLGGFGTIDYITGGYSVTFATAPANLQPITGSYYQEDSTIGGVADFTGTGSDTFRQDDGGGPAMAVWPYQGIEYCFHILRSWLLSIDTSSSPTAFDNQPYYEQIGVPAPRAVFPTGQGVLFLDNSNPANPKFSVLQIPPGSTNLTVVPVSLSDELDLSSFGYSQCVVFSWGDYDIVSCQERVNGQLQDFNGVTFIRNKTSGVWNKLDYFINCLGIYNGTLIAGDSISANVFTLFSGFDDDGAVVSNFHKQAYTNLNIEGIKKCGYIHFEGLIQEAQKLQVWISLDNGAYVLVYTILGNGPYVSSNSVAVGTETIGTTVVGGGFGSQQVFANEYELDIPIHTDKFEYISFMVKAIDVGYVSVNKVEYKDIRFKRRRLLNFEDSEIDN